MPITNAGGDQPVEYYENTQKMQNMQNMQITNAGGDQPVEYYENTQKMQNMQKNAK